jgi:hypothetical protein
VRIPPEGNRLWRRFGGWGSMDGTLPESWHYNSATDKQGDQNGTSIGPHFDSPQRLQMPALNQRRQLDKRGGSRVISEKSLAVIAAIVSPQKQIHKHPAPSVEDRHQAHGCRRVLPSTALDGTREGTERGLKPRRPRTAASCSGPSPGLCRLASRYPRRVMLPRVEDRHQAHGWRRVFPNIALDCTGVPFGSVPLGSCRCAVGVRL